MHVPMLKVRGEIVFALEIGTAEQTNVGAVRAVHVLDVPRVARLQSELRAAQLARPLVFAAAGHVNNRSLVRFGCPGKVIRGLVFVGAVSLESPSVAGGAWRQPRCCNQEHL
jgi:hypothetical protein